MKKRIALCLALVMLLGMLPTALAAEDTMSQQAAQVAAQVKQTLGIGDDYTAFHSEQQQYGQTINWRMEWTTEVPSRYPAPMRARCWSTTKTMARTQAGTTVITPQPCPK